MKPKTVLSLSGGALLGLAMVAPASLTANQPVPARGDELFKQRCQSCHSVDEGGPAIVGPNLAGVVGRKAGATEFRYTPAMKDSGITWTHDQLDAYLAAPMELVPGTRMVVKVPDESARKAIIEYLTENGE